MKVGSEGVSWTERVINHHDNSNIITNNNNNND